MTEALATGPRIAKYCSICGNGLVETAIICPRCGSAAGNSPKPAGLGSWSQTPHVPQRVSYSQAVSSAFRKYARFTGRATRSEYWWFYLFTVLVLGGLAAAFATMAVIGSSSSIQGTLEGTGIVAFIILVVYVLFVLTVFLPTLALTVRRLHDTGQSGWIYLVTLIPFVGGIILFVMLLQPSQSFVNQFDSEGFRS
jgi:uncharacterized membrane protein YhaH (DUF805 family)